jgi:hypothetical protein
MFPSTKNLLLRLLIPSCLSVISITITAFSQTPARTSSFVATKPAAPIAYVYVSQSPVSPGPNQVFGFAAVANGKLTPIVGSPFQADVGMMAVNGKFLFGSTTNELYLNAYTIEPDGALTFAAANDISQITGGNDTNAYSSWMGLDHSGATLYDLRDTGGSDNYYEAFVIDKTTGALTMPAGFMVDAGNNDTWPGAFTFSANNKYMYGVDSGWTAYSICMLDRASNGALLQPPAGTPLISNPVDKTGYRFDPFAISADPFNHVAVAFRNEEGNMGPENGPNQLAVYTADSKGNLTTTNTYKNMPKVAVGEVSLKMAPTGKLLAAFGDKGLQVFHFNGAKPITPYATLVQNVSFGEGYWDNYNHLFAIGSNGKLYVFTVTPTSVAQVPESPYAIDGAQYLIVQPIL